MKMKKRIIKKTFILSGLVAISLGLMACSSPSQENTTTGPEVVKVGAIVPISGPAATYGEDAVHTYTDAVDKFNKAHTGLHIDLIIEDGKCEGKSSVSAIQKLINIDKVQIILGGTCSSESVSTFQIANKKKVAMLSAISSSPELSVEGDYFYRFWNDAHASIGLAKYLSKYSTIAFFNETTDYAQALADKLQGLYHGNYLISEKFSSDEKDFSILASKVKNLEDQIDAIVYLPQTEATAGLLIKALNKEGLLKKFKGRVITAYLLNSDTFLSEIGDLAEGLVEVQITPPQSTKGADYLKYFKSKYGLKSIDYFVTLQREAAELVFDAILDGARTGDQFKTYFDNIDQDHKRSGYFGEYYFDKYGDAIGLEYQMMHIVNGTEIPLDE